MVIGYIAMYIWLCSQLFMAIYLLTILPQAVRQSSKMLVPRINYEKGKYVQLGEAATNMDHCD